jgi:hypothetical protein
MKTPEVFSLRILTVCFPAFKNVKGDLRSLREKTITYGMVPVRNQQKLILQTSKNYFMFQNMLP